MRFMVSASLLLCSLSLWSWGCSSADEAADSGILQDTIEQSDLSEPDDGVWEADTLEQGWSSEQTAGFTQLVTDFVEFGADPGGLGLAIIQGDQRWSSVGGFREMKSGDPIEGTASFKVGSNTKPMIATLIMMLAEEGKLDIDDSLTVWLPQYGDWQDITIRHLLNMTSGLPEYLMALDLSLNILTDPERTFTPAQIIGYARDLDVQFLPGEGCSYTNTNYVLLGMIIEAVSGRTVKQELEDRIIKPLGLEHTYFELAGDSVEALPHGYIDLNLISGMLDAPEMILTMIPQDLFLGDSGVFDGNNMLNPSMTWSAGALVASPEDLATFMASLLRGQLVSEDTLAEMTTFTTCKVLGMDVDYGLGLMRQDTPYGPMIGHEGINIGYHAQTFYLPGMDLALSHTHSFLPAQIAHITGEVMRNIVDQDVGTTTPCPLPGDLFVEDDGPRVQLRFAGLLSEDGADEFTAGMAGAEVDLGRGATRFFGIDRFDIFATARLVPSEDLVELMIPGSMKDGMGLVVLRVPLSTLAQAGEDGLIPVDEASGIHGFVADLELEEARYVGHVARKPVRYHPRAALAFKPGDSLFLCTADGEDLASGRRLRLAGSLGLEQEEAALAGELAAAGLSSCMSATDSGWIPCE